jgi:hypothetical protein
MATTALVLWQPPSIALAELRDALATGQHVWVWLQGARSVEGPVEQVSTTGAYAVIDEIHVPIAAVHAVTLLGAAPARTRRTSAREILTLPIGAASERRASAAPS